ncbi:unnamed protein product [Cuscuta europaea]|uniref:Uncharacterized protein n=1 Tax=Cuscuta europaea TaxID=41803 RepID=A0A9P0Z1U0_CUSEU|nr:unnamed protein product [Cuscuta europaea]
MATRSSEIAPRNCGRRKTKAAVNESAAAAARKKKKQPQRGKGVAELERLLRDPSLKKLTATSSNPTHRHTTNLVNVTVPPLSSVVFSPAAAVPAAAMSNDGIIRAMPLHFPKLLSPYGCYNYGEIFPSSYAHHQHHDLYGFRGCSAPNNPNLFNVIHEKNSKDLSSAPNFAFNRCHLCHQSGVAVERKKKRSSSLSSKGVVEYDFFPEKSRSLYDDDDDMVMMMSMMSAPTPTTTRPSSSDVAAMASTSDGSSSSTTVDLSLRLSY